MPNFERIAPDTLRMERVLDAPIHTVWRWLVEPELRKLWFAGGTTPQAGSELELVFDHDNLSANPVPYPPQYAQWQGATSRERVVRLEPPRLLAFTKAIDVMPMTTAQFAQYIADEIAHWTAVARASNIEGD
jgi:uncharacterized protein YndB with AHSA1/START domain